MRLREGTDKLTGKEGEWCSWLRSIRFDDYTRWSYLRADTGSTSHDSVSRNTRPRATTPVVGPLSEYERSGMATARWWRWSGSETNGAPTPVQADLSMPK